MLAVGPRFDAASCAGLGADCITSWRAWAAQQDNPEGTTNAQEGATGAPK